MKRRLTLSGIIVLAFSSISLAAPITWTGAADNASWHLPGNWDLNRVPDAGDAVTIPDVAGTTTVVFSTGTVTIQSLNSSEALSFNGGTLTVATTAQSSKAVTLFGGALSGGTWTITDTGNALTIGAHSNNQLVNVNVNGDLMLSAADARVKLSGTSTFLNAHVRGGGSSLGFAPGMTLSGDIILEGPSSGQRVVEMNGSSGTLTIGATGSITIGADLSVNATAQIGPSWWTGGAMTLVNGGLIGSDVSACALILNPSALTNNGTLRASNGGTLNAGGTFTNWSSPGTLSVNNGTLTMGGIISLVGATFSRTGGTVNLIGTLNNTALTLNGTTGSWNLAGGAINGGTLAFADGQTLVFKANGANKLSGVTVTGDLFLTESDARVKIEGGTTFSTLHMQGNGASVGFAPGSTLGGNIVMEGAAGGVRSVEMNGTAGTFTIPNGLSIKTAAGLATFATPRIGPSWWFSGAMTLVNNGTISAEASGNTLLVNPASASGAGTFQSLNGATLDARNLSGGLAAVALSGTNAQMWLDGNYSLTQNVTVGAGTTLTLAGTWTNAATLALNGGTLNLGGTFALAALGAFTRNGGTVNLVGTLNNTNLTLNNGTGSWNLLGGTISGGTLAFADGQTLAIKANSANRLSGVAVSGDLFLTDGDARVKIDGNTSFDVLHMQGSGCAVGFAPGTALNGDIVIEGAATGVRAVEMNGTAGGMTIAPGASIKTAAGLSAFATPRVGGGWWFGGSMTLTNNGTIGSEVAGNTLDVNPATSAGGTGTFQSLNGATLNVTNLSGSLGNVIVNGTNSAATLNGSYTLGQNTTVGAGTTLTLNGNWSNAATVNVNGGTLNLGGTFSLAGLGGFSRSGGVVNLTGTLNNTNLTLNNATGTWNLLGGTVSGGTLSFADGQTLAIKPVTTNTLSDVTVNADLVLSESSARVKIAGTTTYHNLRMQGNGCAVGFVPGSTLSGDILFEGAAPGIRAVECAASGATLTIPAGKSIKTIAGLNPIAEPRIGASWWYNAAATLINNGTISGEVAGNQILVGPAVLTNNGEIKAVAGSIRFTKGSVPPMEISNNGQFTLGPGVVFDLAISNLTQTAAGTTSLQIGGPTTAQFGRLIGTGASQLAGTLNLSVVNGFQPDTGDRFRLERFDSLAGTFATVNGLSINAQRKFDLTYGGDSVLAAVIVPGCEGSIPCDLNCDGSVNQFDINPFITALTNATAYGQQFPACDRVCNGDTNGNGSINQFDIIGFVNCLVN